MLFNIGPWDIALVAAVSAQATVLAYLYRPKWKAFVLNLPIPFTIACLAVNRPIDATNVLGLILLLLFTHGVRLLYSKLHLKIIPSIALSAFGYCLIGWLFARFIPAGEPAFWLSCLITFGIAVTLLKIFPDRPEEGHRTDLPVWLKLPIIITVVTFLVAIKKELLGFTTVFPMVGVIAAYEARHSLWTISRQIPVLMLTMIPMMAVCRLGQHQFGLGPSLAMAWVLFLALLFLGIRYTKLIFPER